jgi:hypothetical protein
MPSLLKGAASPSGNSVLDSTLNDTTKIVYGAVGISQTAANPSPTSRLLVSNPFSSKIGLYSDQESFTKANRSVLDNYKISSDLKVTKKTSVSKHKSLKLNDRSITSLGEMEST